MFHDREDAGSRLADHLEHLADLDPVVLGLPRGGMLVAAPIASRLGATLDVFIVRKLPVPQQPELAMGAVSNGGSPHCVLNDSIIDALRIPSELVERTMAQQLREVHRRQLRYRSGRPAAALTDRTLVVVDDGIATGATVRVAIDALRERGPRDLVLAVPVAPPSTIAELEPDVDELVCLEMPEPFTAVGAHYRRFDPVDDDEVMRVLMEGART